ncbi:MAG TPA: tetratricopeptide repeat protein [Haliangium sp.]|nr:tetratricopeptide repeat protein [Haliangium sp.]
MMPLASIRRTLCGLLLAAAAACSTSPRSDAPGPDQAAGAGQLAKADKAASADPAASASRDRDLPDAAFALSYQAAPSSRIARAQAEVRESGGPAAFVHLAEALLARRRETGDLALLGYARDALRAAQARAPRDPAVMRTQLHFLMDDHRFAEARDAARAVIELDPRDTGAHLLLSDALVELGEYDQAIEALQVAMDLEPDLRSYSRTGYLRWLHGDLEGAMASMDTAMRYAGASPEPRAWVYVDSGWMMWQAGQIDAASQAVERALDLVSDYAPALSLKARVLAARGQTREAADLLAGVVERVPSAADLVYLAELLVAAGRKDEAAAHLARAEALATHDPLPLAMHHAHAGQDAARALALAQAALAERDTVYTQAAHALALLRNGRIDEAGKAMERALRLGTPDARLVLGRGLIALAAGDVARAREALDSAQKMNPHADPALLAELRQGLTEVQR